MAVNAAEGGCRSSVGRLCAEPCGVGRWPWRPTASDGPASFATEEKRRSCVSGQTREETLIGMQTATDWKIDALVLAGHRDTTPAWS